MIREQDDQNARPDFFKIIMLIAMHNAICRGHYFDVPGCCFIDNNIMMENFLDDNMCNGWCWNFEKAFKFPLYTLSIKSKFVCRLYYTQYIGSLLVSGR